MGEDKPTNPLDVFWDNLGDKKKKYVRSYGSNKRNSKNANILKKNNGRSYDRDRSGG